MKSRKTKAVVLFLLLAGSSFSQETEKKSFTLAEAIDYALAKHPNMKNAQLDAELAALKRKEITGMGLPQVSGSFDIKDYVELPTSLLPAEIFGGAPGTFIPIRFGTKYNATGGFQATQLLFSSDYLVALQSSNTFKELSEKNMVRSRIEIITGVSKAYYTVLINKERIKLIDANIAKLKKLHDDTKVLNENGFVEKIDVDRLTVSYNNLLTEKSKLLKLIAVTESLLKFQMAYDLKSEITLTENFDINKLPVIELKEEGEFNYSSRIEYSLLESQRIINEFELKRNKLSYLPNVVLYGSLNTQAQRNEFSFFDTGKKWYPISVIGMTISVPIFSGGQKYFKTQQAILNIEKTKNTMESVESAIDLDIQVAKTNYLNALSSIEIQKTNLELSENIFNVAKLKYEQGVGSSIEILNAETSLKEAQTNYYNALYDLYIAKIDYEKASGTIK